MEYPIEIRLCTLKYYWGVRIQFESLALQEQNNPFVISFSEIFAGDYFFMDSEDCLIEEIRPEK